MAKRKMNFSVNIEKAEIVIKNISTERDCVAEQLKQLFEKGKIETAEWTTLQARQRELDAGLSAARSLLWSMCLMYDRKENIIKSW